MGVDGAKAVADPIRRAERMAANFIVLEWVSDKNKMVTEIVRTKRKKTIPKRKKLGWVERYVVHSGMHTHAVPHLSTMIQK